MRLKDPCGLKLRPFGVYTVRTPRGLGCGAWGSGFLWGLEFGAYGLWVEGLHGAYHYENGETNTWSQFQGVYTIRPELPTLFLGFPLHLHYYEPQNPVLIIEAPIVYTSLMRRRVLCRTMQGIGRGIFVGFM